MDSWLEDFFAHIERPELYKDPRFATIGDCITNYEALLKELTDAIAKRDYADWCQRLKTMKGVWAPLQSPAEVLEDPQALENGFVSDVVIDDDTRYKVGASPAQFDEQLIGELRGSPAFGQHTDEILREIGLGEDDIAQLRQKGAIR